MTQGDYLNFEFAKGTHYAGLNGTCQIERIEKVRHPADGIGGIPLFRNGATVITFVEIKDDLSKGVSFRCEESEVIFSHLKFEMWLKILRKMLVEDFKFPSDDNAKEYGADEDWKPYFDDGYSPDEAIREDFNHL